MPSLPRRRLLRRAARLAAALTAAALLAGCSSADNLLGNLLGENDNEVLPGKRESVLGPSAAGARVAAAPVAVPAARRNPDWPQPGGTLSNANHNLALGRGLKRVFAVSAGAGSSRSGRLSAPPVIAGGRVFVLDAKGHVRAFTATGGARIWAVSLVPKGEDADNGYGGGLATDGRVVYAATGFGEVVALAAATGAQLWRTKLGPPVRIAPIVTGGRVYVRDNGDALHALSAADGRELWKQQGEAGRTSLISAAAPAFGAGVLVAPFTSGDITAYSTQGLALWTQNLAGDDAIRDIAARPVIDRGVVYAVSSSGALAALKAATGAQLWSLDLGGRQTPCIAGDYLFHISGRNRLSAIFTRDGAIKWSVTLPGGAWSGPVMGGGRLIAVSSKGKLAEISPQTGQIISKRNIGEAAYIAPVIAGGMLYILADDGTLMAFR